MSNMIYAAIDPGLDGAYTIMTPKEIIVETTPTISIAKKKGGHKRVYDIPTLKRRIANALYYWADATVLCAIEIQRAMPGQGVTSMFSIGFGQGMWEGLLTGMGLPYLLVQPREWQKILTGLSGEGKDKAIMYAVKFFPTIDLRTTEKCRKPHNGKADALCILDWLKRQRT